MSLVTELQKKREQAIEEKVMELAEKMEPRLLESAENGYSSLNIRITSEQEDGHIFKSNEFVEKLNDLMDGVKVKYVVKEKTHLITKWTYKEHYLLFSWGDVN